MDKREDLKKERGILMRELIVPAITEKLDDVIAFVDAQLEQYNCPMDVRFQIDVAVEEIYVNIAHYAYNPEIGEATIRCCVEEEPLQITIEFLDNGLPYDPLSREDPDLELSAEERDIGGLGIYMVKNTMDCVTYQHKDGKNTLSITKRL